jgi:hypothetical protein
MGCEQIIGIRLHDKTANLSEYGMPIVSKKKAFRIMYKFSIFPKNPSAKYFFAYIRPRAIGNKLNKTKSALNPTVYSEVEFTYVIALSVSESRPVRDIIRPKKLRS